MMGLAISLGLDGAAAAGIVTPSVAPPAVIGTAGHTLAASVDPAGGDFDVTVTLDGSPLGTWTLTPEQLEADQHNLIGIGIAGTGTVGQTLTATPGLWLVDPSKSLSAAHQWHRGGTPIAGATGLTYTLVTADAGQSITCRETVGTAYVDSNAISVAALPSLVVARVGGLLSGSNATTNKTFTVNLTGYDIGDRIVFFYGQNEFATAATVNGAAATKLGTDSGTHGTRGRVSAFTYTLTAPGAAGTVIGFTTNNNNSHVFSCHGIKGGSVSAVLQAYSTPGDAIGGSLAIAANGSHVIAIDIGEIGGVPVTWTGVTMVDEAELAVSGTTAATSLAEASGVSAGTLAITANNSGGTKRHGLFAVAIQPD